MMIFPFSQDLFLLMFWLIRTKLNMRQLRKLSSGGTLRLLLSQTRRKDQALLFPLLSATQTKGATSLCRICSIKSRSHPAAGQGHVFMLPSATEQTVDVWDSCSQLCPFQSQTSCTSSRQTPAADEISGKKKMAWTLQKRRFLHVNPKIKLKSV